VGTARPSDADINAAKALLVYAYLVSGRYDEARKLGDELKQKGDVTRLLWEDCRGWFGVPP